MKRLRYLLILIALTLACAGFVPAQNAQTPNSSQPPVKISFLVVDKEGRSIDDVKQDEIQVFDENAPQQITFFERSTAAVSYILAIDNSGSLRSQLAAVIATGQTLIEQNQATDETSLMRFISSDKIQQLVPFTDDKKMLQRELADLVAEGGQTAVTDALYFALQMVAKRRAGQPQAERRYAIVIVTDGEDKNSFYKQEELWRLLQTSNIQVFAVGLVGELDKETGFIRKSSRANATAYLERIAAESGGRAFLVNKLPELKTVVEELGKNLRTQYIVGYTPSDATKATPFHKVKIKLVESPVRKKQKVIAPPGYTTTVAKP